MSSLKYMKVVVLKINMIFFIALICSSCMAQKTEADYRNEENAYAQNVKEAFDVFLNPQITEVNRTQAVEKYAVALDAEQISALKNLARNTQAADQIRAIALMKVKYQVQQDSKLLSDVLKWVQNPNTPTELRNSSLSILGHVSFSAFGMQAVSDQIIETYRDLTDDPNINFRRHAFNFLSQHGDDFAQQLLIKAIQSPQEGLLSQSESIAYLSYDIKGDHYPIVFRVFQETNNENTLMEAIRVLGNYGPARSRIVEILRDNKQKEAVRIAAIKTLNAFDQENFADHFMPLFRDRNTPDELFVYAINAEKYRRDNNAVRATKYRNGKYVADKFDQQVINLSKSNFSDNAVRAARIYVRTLNFE